MSATAGGTAVRIWCSAAPPGSEIRKKLDESGAARVAWNPPVVDAGKDFDFTPDRGGAYQLIADELERGSGFTGAYEGDPRGAPTERIITSSSMKLFVAEELTSALGFGGDRATIVLHIFGEEIMQARKNVHGLVSPRIDLPSQPTSRARGAAESQGVKLALSLFTNNSGNDFPPERILGDQAAIVDALIGNINFHLRGTTNHNTSAAAEVIPDDFLDPQTNAGMLVSLAKVRQTLDRHVRNDDGSGVGSATWHDGDGGRVSWAAVPLVSASEQTIDACLADLCRCYALHINSTVHNSPGGVEVNLFQSSILLWMHQLFLQEIATPTPPTTENPLTSTFVARGFTRP